MGRGSFETVIVECQECKATFKKPGDDFSYYGTNDPCDTCGSHGEIEATTKCPECGAYLSIVLSSW